ncbi:hypothetical protein AMELA_G00082940 [Ameiurus melas]|uniref:Uncharacterized protein n=1 Tax=Ameiurus melas TaxID=219545 RepID=A0A7J6B061_AMEME|nr:hypothetical protein AMELA_G00082940 [Ameiurus melas]
MEPFRRLLFLLPIMGNLLASTEHLDCSVGNNITCDCVRNATLDTAEFSEKYRDCDWSLRNKLICDSPKREVFLVCYQFASKTEPFNAGETLLQSHVIILCLCLCCWRYLL